MNRESRALRYPPEVPASVAARLTSGYDLLPNGCWQVAQTTLAHERGTRSLALVTRYLAAFWRLVDLSRRLRRSGAPLVDSPVVRQKLGKIYADIEVLRYGALYVLSQLEKGAELGPRSSITKLAESEFDKRFHETAQEILGPYGRLTDGIPDGLPLAVESALGDPGTWADSFLWSRAGTIYSGTSEIQKNIIGERILGLPRERRPDRP